MLFILILQLVKNQNDDLKANYSKLLIIAEEPTPARTHVPGSDYNYIDKNFTTSTLTGIQIRAGEGGINEISGCYFQDIKNQYFYYIRMCNEIPFYNNVFENSEYPISEPPGVLFANFNGRLIINNCKFIRIVAKPPNGHVINSNGGNIGQIFIENCEFFECGRPGNMPLITVLNQLSSINFKNSNFTYIDATHSCMIVGIKSNEATFDNCRFIQCGNPLISLGYKNSESAYEANGEGEFVFTNNYVKSNNGQIIHCDKMLIKPIISNNTFEDIIIKDTSFINIFSIISEIELINNTFARITNIGTDESMSGGLGILITSFLDEFTLRYEKCKFYDIINSHTTTPRSQGGAIQFGFLNSTLNKCIEIINCEFKRNKAKRHGGALSIRTGKSVLIRDCEFESNVANNENNSSELLFTNHYEWKNKGFGGAIYLNPTFRTDDGNDYCMKNVTITNCIFRMNRAYQGYAIYIEGENCETTFSINDNNQFIDNYESENSPSGGGIIASEITTIDINHIKTENSFSNSDMYRSNHRHCYWRYCFNCNCSIDHIFCY